jgi:hypothetical protein
MNYREIVNQIREAKNHKITPSTQQGKVNIEIQTQDGNWKKILSDVSQGIAEDTVRQAQNRLLLG